MKVKEETKLILRGLWLLVGPGGRDLTVALKSRKTPADDHITNFLHILQGLGGSQAAVTKRWS